MQPSTSRVIHVGLFLWLVTCLFPAPLHAEEENTGLLLEATCGTPLRTTVGASLVHSHDFGKAGGGGIVVGGAAGLHGMRVAGGIALVGYQGVSDIRAVVSRTWDNPTGASANSTYVGGEVGVGVRISVERRLRPTCRGTVGGP